MIKSKNAIILTCLFVAVGLNAQTLKIDDCYKMAKKNFPLVKQYELIEKTKEFSLKNAQKAYLPQVGIYGQVSYQSDVTQIPIDFSNVPVPGLSDVKMPTLPADQYKIYGEISYSLTDPITTKNQSDLIKANAEIETQKLEVELYKLHERINALFFGILLINAQIVQTEIVRKDIENGIERTQTAIANGVALKSSVDNLKAESLKIKQRITELKAVKKGYLDMLSLFVGEEIKENTTFEKPSSPSVSDEINRPEMRLYLLQNKALELQNRLVIHKNLPRLNLFFQGGFGKPALNMFSENLDPFYITGIRLAWNLSGFYSFRNERKQIENQQNSIQVQQKMFLFNTHLALSQQNAEIAKMQELLEDDNEIILLHQGVKNATQTQLDNGTATTNDYLLAVNAEDQAQQNRILHEIQLLMAQYNENITKGN